MEGAGDEVQWLEVVSSTHVEKLTTTCNSSCRWFQHLWTPGANTQRQTYQYVHILKGNGVLNLRGHFERGRLLLATQKVS